MANLWDNNSCAGRWGVKTGECQNQEVANSIPLNTRKTKKYVWSQFAAFCTSRNYELTAETSVEHLGRILQDWAYNMRKSNGEDYRESVVKSLWNGTAKLLQEKYYNEYKIAFNPFLDIAFKEARDARDVKRRQLKSMPETCKRSAGSFTVEELNDIQTIWDEDTPDGLQRKFYHIATTVLGWSAWEAATTHLGHFVVEVDASGCETGRIKYNPITVKTSQSRSNIKFLTPNTRNPSQCPVRLFKKLLQQRPTTVTSKRLFLTPNRFWFPESFHAWYKNIPIGMNQMSKWTGQAAEKIGIDTKIRKITNYTIRNSAVAHLSTEMPLRQPMRKTGDRSAMSIETNLEMDIPLLQTVVDQLPHSTPAVVSKQNFPCGDFRNSRPTNIATLLSSIGTNCPRIVFNNCTFNILS